MEFDKYIMIMIAGIILYIYMTTRVLEHSRFLSAADLTILNSKNDRVSVPVMCKSDGSWSINTPVNVGTVITKNCPAGGSQSATCNADGSWYVGNCPKKSFSFGW